MSAALHAQVKSLLVRIAALEAKVAALDHALEQPRDLEYAVPPGEATVTWPVKRGPGRPRKAQ